MYFNDISDEGIRHIINTEQAFEARSLTRAKLATNFRGSMSWKTLRGVDYLYRYTKGIWKSVGQRSPATEEMFRVFQEGKALAEVSLAETEARIKGLALINRGMRLGRVPSLMAKILRRLDDVGLLGKNIRVVGTNSLYAYEAAASVHFGEGLLATEDVDLLFEARAKLKLAVDYRVEGVVKLLREVDKSFDVMPARNFTAINKRGFMVDLITPHEKRNVMLYRRLPSRIGQSEDDLSAVEIEGLAWLASSRAFEAVAIGEDGLPVRLVCPDPRAFALHKLWLSERPGRKPGKRKRDRSQAEAVIALCTERLLLTFDDPALQSLPLALRKLAPGIS